MLSYREVFFAHNGIGPHKCWRCEQVIDPEANALEDRLQVHHLDHDHFNDTPSNLVALHRGCHTKHHNAVHITNGTGMMRPEVMAQRLASGFGSFEAGQRGREVQKELGTAFYDSEAQRKNSRRADHVKGGKAARETNKKNGTGLFDPAVRAAGQRIIREQKLGFLSFTAEQRSELGKQVGAARCAQRRKCNECDQVMNPLGMGRHQKAKNHSGWTEVL